MDFTREPIIETIITPKDGCKLAIRSSKASGQEEYFVDSIEVVTFGHAHFYRSTERPKSFLVPVSDYEVVEVREARMVLKNLGPDRSIKIGGGRGEGTGKMREAEKPVAPQVQEEESAPVVEPEAQAEVSAEAKPDSRLDKKRDRRRHYRKRRNGKDEPGKEEGSIDGSGVPRLEADGKVAIAPPDESSEKEAAASEAPLSSQMFLLQPPPMLISETINRYRDNALFKNAFFLPEEEQYKPHEKVQELLNEDDDTFPPHLKEPAYEPLAGDFREEFREDTGFNEDTQDQAGSPGQEGFDAGSQEDPDEAVLPLFSDESTDRSQSDEDEFPLYINGGHPEKQQAEDDAGDGEIVRPAHPKE